MSEIAPAGPVTAWAGTNIALVKYWGKRDAALNLPATGSLSLTLDHLGTTTTVRFDPRAHDDVIQLDGALADTAFCRRASRFLDLVRQQAGFQTRAQVQTRNSVPTAAGLASSASGFAALALAATRAAGLDLPPAELSALARRGSGSAARSIFGGFVEMARGERQDGADACAHPLLPPDAWAVRLVVALTTKGAKSIGSTEAMDRTARTSPYYAGWITSTQVDLSEARAAIAVKDLAWLGPIAERSALRMHACALGADPPILYWNPATVAALEAVRGLRASGVAAYATIDAGPHVKVLCGEADAAAVEAALQRVPGVTDTIVASPGPGAAVIPTPEDQA